MRETSISTPKKKEKKKWQKNNEQVPRLGKQKKKRDDSSVIDATIPLSSIFSINWRNRILVGQGGKHLDSTNFSSSLSFQPNTHKINFLSAFFSLIFYPPCFNSTQMDPKFLLHSCRGATERKFFFKETTKFTSNSSHVC